ncbi:MAG TPA: dinitrogenase iron-molybdenum cofactor biosynthesis protein [bacterium]|nr:dinitrogenase iron-molybdenum cofactor biosynthesis protein [bacterium]
MKITITSKGKCLTDDMDPRFGRCAKFIVYETDSGVFEVFENESAAMPGGAGIQAVQFMISKDVKAVKSGSFGPNAYNTLIAAGIDMYSDTQGKVIEVVNRFKDGKLQKVSEAGTSKKA